MASGGDDFASSVIEFSFDLFKAVGAEENAFMSPCSVLIVMAMVQLGAAGKTLEQMASTLKLQLENKGAWSSIQNFLKTMKKPDQNFTLSVANKLYPHLDKTIEEDYQKTVIDMFTAAVESLDYTKDPEGSRLVINQWVEKETRDKIKDILASGTVTSLTAMVVVNAIYFKGDWSNKFDKDLTSPEQFFISKDRKVVVDMMSKRFKKVQYGESRDLGCKVLQLPYKGESLSMVIILPNDYNGLSALESKLNVKTLKSLMSTVHPSTVDVSLPKFKLETTYSLKDILSKLGMTDLFDVNRADLSKMSKSEQLFVSHVVHKAFVQVDEEGTEAAAATAAVMMKRSIVMAQSFRADHPFIFVIWDGRVKAPLFMGRCIVPTTSAVSQEAHDEL